MTPTIKTAAMLIIGDEILSGRTRDINLQTVAEFLGPLGVQMREARVVPDVEDTIVAALNALRASYDYVFTSGGIGPTHDDITADAVAKACGVGIGEHPKAVEMLAEKYGEQFTPARRRMARIPDGADLIANPSSTAPGFQIGNVFVLAGVPGVLRAMLEDIPHRIVGGAVMHAVSVRGPGVFEGQIGDDLRAIAVAYPDLSIGSYPYFDPMGNGTVLVVRGYDREVMGPCVAAIESLMARHTKK